VQLHQQKGMISLSPPTICNSADTLTKALRERVKQLGGQISPLPDDTFRESGTKVKTARLEIDLRR
ncbi:hypothetical protein WI749_24595, partial [Salmonella enterica subsp. enterica serovar Corvallis]